MPSRDATNSKVVIIISTPGFMGAMPSMEVFKNTLFDTKNYISCIFIRFNKSIK